jgi:hypothetical protein
MRTIRKKRSLVKLLPLEEITYTLSKCHFLLNSGRAAASQSSLKDTEDSETQPPDLEVPVTVHKCPTTKDPPAKRWKGLETHLLNYLQAPLSTSVTEPEEDKAFFDSLIPTVKTLTIEQKLDF